MQVKHSHCPAPLGRGATPYTVKYSTVGLPNVRLQTARMACLKDSAVPRLTICSGTIFQPVTVLGKIKRADDRIRMLGYY